MRGRKSLLERSTSLVDTNVRCRWYASAAGPAQDVGVMLYLYIEQCPDALTNAGYPRISHISNIFHSCASFCDQHVIRHDQDNRWHLSHAFGHRCLPPHRRIFAGMSRHRIRDGGLGHMCWLSCASRGRHSAGVGRACGLQWQSQAVAWGRLGGGKISRHCQRLHMLHSRRYTLLVCLPIRQQRHDGMVNTCMCGR